MSLLNEKGELPKGLEILARQIIKMVGIDPEVTLAQISGIHDLLSRHVAQQDEILSMLKELKDGQSVSNQRTEQRDIGERAAQSERSLNGA